MLPHRDSRLTRFVLIAFFVVVLIYAYYEGRGFLFGPSIDVSPAVLEVSEQSVTIEGRADRIVALSMNGMEIPITEAGEFSEVYILTPGYNRVVLTARDRYGKTTERIVEIVYKPTPLTSTTPVPPPSQTATTTPIVAPQ